MIDDVIAAYVDGATAEGYAEDWDLDQLWTGLKHAVPDRRDRRGARATPSTSGLTQGRP